MSIGTRFLDKAGGRMARLSPQEQAYVATVLKCADSVEEKSKVLYAAGLPQDSVVLNDWCNRVAGPPGLGSPGSALGGLVTRWGGLESVGAVQHEIKRIHREDPEFGKKFAEINGKYSSRTDIRTTGRYVLNVQKAIGNVDQARRTLEKAGHASQAATLEHWLNGVRGYHTTREYTDGTITSIYVPDPYIHYDVQYTPGLVEKIGLGPGKLSVSQARAEIKHYTGSAFAEAMKAARQIARNV